MSSLICTGQQIPEFFGVYIVADGRLIELKEKTVRIKTANKGGMQEDCVTGLSKLSEININDEAAYLIIFLENFDINSIKLSKLRYVNAEPLVSIPIIGNAEKVMTNINMWVLEKDIPFRTGPIEGKKGMYKIAPNAGFEPGVYALHQGSIRRSRIQGGQIGLLLQSGEYGNTAFDFSFNLGKNKGETAQSQTSQFPTAVSGNTRINTETTNKSQPPVAETPLPKKPSFEATEANLIDQLDKALKEIVKARQSLNPGYAVGLMKNAINYLNTADEIALALNKADVGEVITKTIDLLNKAIIPYSQDSYEGIGNIKDARKMLETLIKKIK